MSTVAHECEYLTVAEVAMKLHCSAPSIRRRIAAGELPAVQLGGPGSSIRVRRDELEAWLYGEREAGP
jgi:excisionase family DNA binding protein